MNATNLEETGAGKVLGVIPSRWASTRFPGKPLHEIAGKTLIRHVWDRCVQCSRLGMVVVATDDERIADAVREFGGEAVMTDPDLPSGTDRIAVVAREQPEYSHVINIQGDEPLIDPGLIDQLADAMLRDPSLPMITAANPMAPDHPDGADPNVVKVTIDQNGRALYFSRSPIPYLRDAEIEGLQYYRHKGIYGFKREFLLDFVSWPPSLLERVEGLEQLRAMENGMEIRVILTDDESPGIDTPEQAAILHEQLLS